MISFGWWPAPTIRHPDGTYAMLALVAVRASAGISAWVALLTLLPVWLFAPDQARAWGVTVSVAAVVLIGDQIRRRRRAQRALAEQEELSELEKARRAVLAALVAAHRPRQPFGGRPDAASGRRSGDAIPATRPPAAARCHRGTMNGVCEPARPTEVIAVRDSDPPSRGRASSALLMR